MTNIKGEAGQVGLLLVGINNSPTPWKPCLELGFNSERFRVIEDRSPIQKQILVDSEGMPIDE
jgi:hypothetical protein